MGSCSKVVGLLLDYLEGRLSTAEQSALEEHLARCANCVAYVKTYRSTVSLLRSIREEDLPPDLRTSLHAFLDHRADN